MSERRALTSGVVLADRYELHDQVSARLGSVTWRALDLVLNRNVGVELIPSSDPRAPHFLEAARRSTLVTDARFLRVLDLLENQHGHHVVVREWAKAFGLNQVLAQSPVPSRRAAHIVAEVAEAIAHAHERGQYHRRLTPHHVLVKESGAVRIVGLGLASALDQPDHTESAADLVGLRAGDVRALGNLLYASLTGRWPGGEVDQLPPAHRSSTGTRCGRVRCVPASPARWTRSAIGSCRSWPVRTRRNASRRPRRSRARSGWSARCPASSVGPKTATLSSTRESPDLLRADPVLEPAGPAPGIDGPRRPEGHQPPPPTRIERAQALPLDATRDDRRFVIAGVLGALSLLLIIGGLAVNGAGVNVGIPVHRRLGANDLPSKRSTTSTPRAMRPRTPTTRTSPSTATPRPGGARRRTSTGRSSVG